MIHWLTGKSSRTPRKSSLHLLHHPGWVLQGYHGNYSTCAYPLWPWCWSRDCNEVKNPVMVHVILRNPFHNEAMLKLLLSPLPPPPSSKCLVYPRNKTQSVHVTMAVYFAFSSTISLSFCYHSLIRPQFQQVPCLIFEKISLHRRTKMSLDSVVRPNTLTQKSREISVCSTKIFWLLSEVSENNIKVPWEYGRVPKTEGATEAISIYQFRLSSFPIHSWKLSIVSACLSPWP